MSRFVGLNHMKCFRHCWFTFAFGCWRVQKTICWLCGDTA